MSIAAGLVTAIGFIGAGAISAHKRSLTGMTTAAGLWATVGVGMAVGAGMYPISAFATVFIVAIQAILHRDHAWLGGIVVHIRLEDHPDALERFQADLAGLGLASCPSKYEREDGVLAVELHISHLSCPERELGRVLAPLMQQPYIKSILW